MRSSLVVCLFASIFTYIAVSAPMKSMLGAEKALYSENEEPYSAQVEYLVGDGNSWIDTGFIMPDNASYAIYLWRGISSVPPYQTIYGSRISSFNKDFQVTLYFGYLLVRNGLNTSQFGNTIQGNYFEVLVDGNKDLYVNGEFKKNVGGIGYADLPLYVMALNENGTAIQIANSNIYFYGMKVCDSNGVLSLDIIPVRVGDEGFMYDRVSGELFENEGIGAIVLGPDL